MNTRRAKPLGYAAIAVVMVLATLVWSPAPAQAQDANYETCSAYGYAANTGGQLAADAAARLKALDAPNPFGLDNALDTIINGEADVPPIGSRPTTAALQEANTLLVGYYGDICGALDICPLIRQAAATNDEASADAARLARGMTTPAPPGIDAALAFIAGDIATSPFHDSVAEAQAQITSYFPCQVVATPTPVVGVPSDVAATCGDLAVLSIPEGPRAIEAAESLRARGAPNPPGIEAALDVIVAAADFSTSSPPLADVDAALATLAGYFGGACNGIDRCGFVAQIRTGDAATAAQAARLLGRIETPAPPGISAALALIAGDITESPFHANVAEARAQILSYYPCGGTDVGSGGGDGLAFTGTSLSAPLAALGAALLASGAGLLHTRRRLLGTGR